MAFREPRGGRIGRIRKLSLPATQVITNYNQRKKKIASRGVTQTQPPHSDKVYAKSSPRKWDTSEAN